MLYARDGIVPMAIDSSVRLEKSVAAPAPTASSLNSVEWAAPVSTTNIQVLGVDEADSVKTDGINLYTYSEESREVRIVRASDLTLENTIKLPDTFSSVQLYLSNGKLIIIGTKYSNTGNSYTYRWYAPEVKTVVAVYRVTDPMKAVLERYNQIDGNYRDSRMIEDTLYFVSTSDLRLPPLYMTNYSKNANGFQDAIKAVEKDFSIKNLAPEIRESYLGTKGKYIQNIRASVANCKDVTFVLPDANTLKNIEFTPTLVSLSSVNTRDPTAKMKSELVFGDVSQIHMSRSSLYITSTISQNSSSSTCPPNAKCFAPSYTGESSTLIHRYALSNGWLSYKYTTSVVGNPMNQYSMDEDASGNFRIVTQSYAWSSGTNQNSTQVSIISPSGKIIGKLSGIAPGENFQSARFIADRLYLVTFQQIDPLFVISLADPKFPKILGELKIPGYSTYLHPYGTDRLIGLWYDTKTNQWGGTQNGGLKIDLYNVSDVKNPKQEQSLVLGDAGSSAEALSNPRAFVWYKEKNLLLLPATLMKSANDKNDSYRSQGAFQWIVWVSILPSDINEKFRVTHIALDPDLEKSWKKECAQYTSTKPTCQKLLDGSEYCGGGSSYVPPYCYAGSTIDTYFANQIWNYQRDFVTRALYVGETFYSLAEGGIKSWNFSNTIAPKASVTFLSNPVKSPIYPVPMMAK
jgi:inhibitor of cysteine peptidase